MNVNALLAIALAATALHAQTPPCFATNDATNVVSSATSNWSLFGANVSAWQVTPATPVTVQSLRVFVGNTFGLSVGAFMNLAIWSDDPATHLPQTRLAHGTWKYVSANCWQGANLDAPVAMQANASYWVALTEPGWSTLPIEPGGNALPSAQQQSGVWSTGAAPQALKLRLYCGLLEGARVATSGAACASSSGRFGTVFTNDSPSIGNAGFYVEGSGLPGNTIAFLVIGIDPNWTSLQLPGARPTCMVSTDPLLFLTSVTGLGDIRSSAPLGHATWPIAVPGNPGLAGLGINAQIAALDLASTYSLPLITSNRVRFTLY
jgi:hypothetical protein